MAAIVALLCPGVWHKGFFVFFAALGALLISVHADSRTVRTAVYCGAVSAVAFVFRQDIGVYIALAFLLVDFWCAAVDRRTAGMAARIGSFALAGAVTVTPVLVYFAYEGALSDMLGQILFAGSAGTSANNLPFPPLMEFWSGGLVATLRSRLFYLPFAIYIIAAVLLVARSIRNNAEGRGVALFGLVAFGLLVSLQLKNRSDSAHLWQVMPPVFVVAALLAESLRRRFTGVLPCIAAGLLFGWMAVAGVGDRASGSIAEMKGNDTRLNLPRAGVYVPGAFADMLIPTLNDIEKYTANGPYGMLAAPDIPILYFLADKRNPTRHELFRAGIASDSDTQRGLVEEVERRGVRLVVYNLSEYNDGRPERSMKAHSPVFYGYITENFQPVARHGMFELRLRDKD
jgi:hypothetical protein